MASRNFKLHIFFRVIVLACSISTFLYFLLVYVNYLRSAYLLVLIIAIIAEFLYYINKTNRDLSNFLTGILQNDYSTRFSEKGKGKSFNRLYQTLNRINQQFKKISSEKEAQFLYLETLVEHIKIGIISYNNKGEIHLLNQAFKQLIRRPHLKNIKALGVIDHDLLNIVETIGPAETKLVRFINHGKLLQLSINCSVFKIQNDTFRLLSFQNIKNELEAHELETWQKLIRVLTHEIMNSVTPITSLTSTLQGIVAREIDNGVGSPTMEKLNQGLDAIQSRSRGLQKFTETYRNLTRIPPPKIARVSIQDLINRTLTLMQPKFDEKNIAVHKFIKNPEGSFYADNELFQQVLINVLNNAVEALAEKENPEITLMINEDENGKHIFSIRDNGSGIAPDKVDKIFIPFFTTKKEGSGIGLALSRQILQLHNSTINVLSEPGEGTVFTIVI